MIFHTCVFPTEFHAYIAKVEIIVNITSFSNRNNLLVHISFFYRNSGNSHAVCNTLFPVYTYWFSASLISKVSSPVESRGKMLDSSCGGKEELWLKRNYQGLIVKRCSPCEAFLTDPDPSQREFSHLCSISTSLCLSSLLWYLCVQFLSLFFFSSHGMMPLRANWTLTHFCIS